MTPPTPKTTARESARTWVITDGGSGWQGLGVVAQGPSFEGKLMVTEYSAYQALEGAGEEYRSDMMKQQDRIEALELTNRTLREALEFYADEENYDFGVVRVKTKTEVGINSTRDLGFTARKALEEK